MPGVVVVAAVAAPAPTITSITAACVFAAAASIAVTCVVVAAVAASNTAACVVVAVAAPIAAVLAASDSFRDGDIIATLFIRCFFLFDFLNLQTLTFG